VNGNYNFFAPTDEYLIQESNATGAGYSFVYSYLTFLNGTGTVSSVNLALPASVFLVTGGPVTSTGTLTGAFIAQSANTVFGNCTGSSAVPNFCSLVAGQIPSTLNASTINGLAVAGNETVSGTLGVTGVATLSSNAIVGGTLGVTGAATLSSTLGVTGNTTVGGYLTVAGYATVTGLLSANGGMAITGNVTSGGNISNPTGYINSGGYQLGSSYGTAGDCLQSVGYGTIFSPTCSNGSTPTVAAGTGAGTSPTVTLVTGSTDRSGAVQAITGTTPAATATVFTLTFSASSPFATYAFCTISPITYPAATLSGAASVILNQTVSDFLVISNSTPLTGALNYSWSYTCGGH